MDYKKMVAVLFFGMFLFGYDGLNLYAASSEIGEISLLLRNGSVVLMAEKDEPVPSAADDPTEIDRFVKLKSLNLGGIVYTYDAKVYKMDWPEILKNVSYIELFDPELSPYKNGRMVVKRKSGDKLKTSDGTLLRYIGYDTGLSEITVIKYDSYHKFWREVYLDIRDVKIIRFEKEAKKKDTAFENLNFARTSEEMVASLTKPQKNNKKESEVNLNIEFDFDSHKIRSSSYSVLNELGQALNDTKLMNKNIIIKGHTDSDGPEAYNQNLSLRRARSVRTYLVSNCAVRPDRITTAGYGEKEPLVPNTTPANKQINRRVEIRARL